MKGRDRKLRIRELDPRKVANALLHAPLLANQLGHKWLKSTFNSHILPDPDDLETQFVRDLMLLDTETIIETWYGGQEEAIDLMLWLKRSENNSN